MPINYNNIKGFSDSLSLCRGTESLQREGEKGQVPGDCSGLHVEYAGHGMSGICVPRSASGATICGSGIFGDKNIVFSSFMHEGRLMYRLESGEIAGQRLLIKSAVLEEGDFTYLCFIRLPDREAVDMPLPLSGFSLSQMASMTDLNLDCGSPSFAGELSPEGYIQTMLEIAPDKNEALSIAASLVVCQRVEGYTQDSWSPSQLLLLHHLARQSTYSPGINAMSRNTFPVNDSCLENIHSYIDAGIVDNSIMDKLHYLS